MIHLNLVAKGVSGTPRQAIKFPKEKLAHGGRDLDSRSNRLLAQIISAITNLAGAKNIILKACHEIKEAQPSPERGRSGSHLGARHVFPLRIGRKPKGISSEFL